MEGSAALRMRDPASSPPQPRPCFSPVRSVTRLHSASLMPSPVRTTCVLLTPSPSKSLGLAGPGTATPQAGGGGPPPSVAQTGGMGSTRPREAGMPKRELGEFSLSAKELRGSRLPGTMWADKAVESVNGAGNMQEGVSTWSVHRTARLVPEDASKSLVNRAPCIDRSNVSSVSSAVEQLNRGDIQCAEGLCIVYSSSAQAEFLLYRKDRAQDIAEAGLSATAGSSPAARHQPSVAAPMSPTMPQVVMSPNVPRMSLTGNGAVQVIASPQLPNRRLRFDSPRRAPAPMLPAAAMQSSPNGSPKNLDLMTSLRTGEPGLSPATTQMTATPSASPKNTDVLTPTSRASFAPMGGDAAPGSAMHSPRRCNGSGRLPVAPDAQAPKEMAAPAPPPGSKPTQHRDGRFLTPRSYNRCPASPMMGNVRRSLTLSPTATRCLQQGLASPTRASFVAVSEEPQREQQLKRPAEGPGEVHDVGGRQFRFLDVLGCGAFGIVWRAREKDSDTDVAVKVINSKDEDAFAVATFEADLLQMLTAACSRLQCHVPRYITHTAVRKRDAGAGGVVRLAMSYVPGGAFDRWIYGISDEDHKTAEISKLIDGHFPGGQQGQWELGPTCTLVRELLCQLSRVFGALQPIAFHRDVSAHNVLMDLAPGATSSSARFALIDFGLAVRSSNWSQKWRSSNLAGDPRYWTPAAWMAFGFGFKYVTSHPNSGFQQQYLTRMDHFGLGIMGLEALFALCSLREGDWPGMREARAAWAAYWATVVNLFQMFHTKGPQEVRGFLAHAREGGVGDLVGHLRRLRQTLRAAAVHPPNGHCAALLLVLADLVDEKGTVSWEEIPGMISEDLPDVRRQTAAGGLGPRRS